MPIEIQTSSAWGRLADKFRLTGRHKLLLDEVLVGVVLVEDLSAEAAQPEQDVSYRFLVPASAVANGKAILFNGATADTGRDIIIDRVLCASAANANYDLRFTTNAPLAPIAASDLEKQWRAVPQVGVPPGNMYADSGAIIGPELWRIPAIANTLIDVEVGVRLGSIQGLSLQCVANNLTFFATFFGRVVPRL